MILARRISPKAHATVFLVLVPLLLISATVACGGGCSGQSCTFKAVSGGAIAAPDQPGFAQFYKGGSSFYDVTGGGGGGRGFNVAALDPKTFALVGGSVAHFDTWASRETGTDMNNLIAFLNGLPNGTPILIAVADEAGLNYFPSEGNPCTFLPDPWVQQGLQTLQSLGSQQIGSYCYQYSWAMIAVKGEGTGRSEQLAGPTTATAQGSLTKE